MSLSPHIEITPSTAQYRELIIDLQLLREAGADSNTAAIIDAVHRQADEVRAGYDGPDLRMAGQRRSAPGPAPGGQS